VTTEEISEEELRARIERLYEQFPMLRDYAPPSTCCGGCKEQDIAHEYGRNAANAWAAIDIWRWLLGEES
jgi:bacterioferritin-associated ferredoxin